MGNFNKKKIIKGILANFFAWIFTMIASISVFCIYCLSAKQGNTEANLKLGDIYKLINCNAKAEEHYLIASHNGNNNASMKILEIYMEKRQYKKAEFIAGVIIASNNSEKSQIAFAEKKLGDIYRNGGREIPKDPYKAFESYKLSADKGNQDAMFILGLMYAEGEGTEKNMEQAARMYEMSAKSGNSDAQNSLALLYENGEGVNQNYNEALKWYKMSANQDYDEAQYNLAQMYEKGHGVSADKAEARNWYSKAAAQGHKEAQAALERLGKR